MHCKNCGTENTEQANFCEKCGAPLKQQEEKERTEVEKQAQAEPSDAAPAPSALNQNRNKQIIITASVLAVIAACIIGIMLYTNSQKQAEYTGKLQTADKYLAAMDYEKAETVYLEAIRIQPKKEDAYIKLADVYTSQGKYEKAIDTLKKGKEKAGGKKIEAKLKETQKASKLGTANAQYQAYYELCAEYRQKYGNPDFITNEEKYGPSEDDEYSESTGEYGELQGLCVTKLYDFDKDGNQELLLAYQKEKGDELEQTPQDFQYEIWAWQDNNLVNVLPATAVNTGQDVTSWIETSIKENTIYLIIDRTAWDGPAQYMQYESGKFNIEYEYEEHWPEDGTEEFTYIVNGKTLSAKAFEEEIKSFPKSKIYNQTEDQTYDPNSKELLIEFRYLTADYAQAVLDEAEATVERLKDASADADRGAHKTYQSLCAEYQEKYGKPGYEKWDGSDYYNLTGLCVVRLIDFDKDGNQELLLGYADKNAMGGYAYEVWAQQDSAVQVLNKMGPPHSNGECVWIETADKNGAIYLWGYEDTGEKEEYLRFKDGKFTPEYVIGYQDDPDVITINGELMKLEDWNRLSEEFGWYASAENHYLKKGGKWSIPMAFMEAKDKDAVLKDTNQTLKKLENN
ncbi:MAG: zinc-ribbon domain-containing protein [Firmicutes bacterium]|nr:zinc-ribbon domain-containing protein [Bacillota bacterium]